MKKHYKLKEKWGIALFYLVLVVLTLIYSNSIRQEKNDKKNIGALENIQT